MKHFLFWVNTAAVFSFFLFSCGVRWVDIPQTITIYVNTSGKNLTEEEIYKYPSKIKIPYQFHPKTSFNSITFISQDKEIACIVSSGYVQAVSAGNTIIEAIPNNKTYEKDVCFVKVLPVP